MINVQKLEEAIQSKLIDSTLTSEQILNLSKAAEAITSISIITIKDPSYFPDAAMYINCLCFVESQNQHYQSNGIVWLPIFYVNSTLFTWGHNGAGQLGDFSTNSRASPSSTVANEKTWVQISTGGATSFGIKNDGTLWTWGRNDFGQLGNNTGTTVSTSSPGTIFGGGNNWRYAEIGFQSAIALKSDGTLWTWGRNQNGNLGSNDTPHISFPKMISGGGNNWKQISINFNHAAAIKTDGTLWTWGGNVNFINQGQGQLGDGTVTNRSSPGTTAGGGINWKQVTCGTYSTAAIKTDGTLWTWGTNTYGQLGDATTTSRSSPQTVAGGGFDWKQVHGSNYSYIALKTDGSLWTWGRNDFGQLGNATTTSRSSPGTTAGGGTDWIFINTGSQSMAAIKNNGILWTWGDNSSGQLGDGTQTSRSSPGTVAGRINTWISVSVASDQNYSMNGLFI